LKELYIYIPLSFFLAEIERGKEELGSCTMVGIIRLRFFSHIKSIFESIIIDVF
jgi:hypothetical protein